MRLIHSNLFVISGGPGAGKTTLLQELARSGFHQAPEVARQIIQEQVQTGGTALPWSDRVAYIHLMLQRSIESFLAYTPMSQPAFSDRGIPDTLYYARLVGLQDTRWIEDACDRYRYANLVFLAPPWEQIYATDTERKQDFAEAEETYAQMVEVYRECAYKLIELPRGTPSERARFVLRQLSLSEYASRT